MTTCGSLGISYKNDYDDDGFVTTIISFPKSLKLYRGKILSFYSYALRYEIGYRTDKTISLIISLLSASAGYKLVSHEFVTIDDEVSIKIVTTKNNCESSNNVTIVREVDDNESINKRKHQDAENNKPSRKNARNETSNKIFTGENCKNINVTDKNASISITTVHKINNNAIKLVEPFKITKKASDYYTIDCAFTPFESHELYASNNKMHLFIKDATHSCYFSLDLPNEITNEEFHAQCVVSSGNKMHVDIFLQ